MAYFFFYFFFSLLHNTVKVLNSTAETISQYLVKSLRVWNNRKYVFTSRTNYRLSTNTISFNDFYTRLSTSQAYIHILCIFSISTIYKNVSRSECNTKQDHHKRKNHLLGSNAFKKKKPYVLNKNIMNFCFDVSSLQK